MGIAGSGRIPRDTEVRSAGILAAEPKIGNRNFLLHENAAPGKSSAALRSVEPLRGRILFLLLARSLEFLEAQLAVAVLVAFLEILLGFSCVFLAGLEFLERHG